MKTRILATLAASLTLTLGTLTAAEETYYWNPNNITTISDMGGTGTWDNTTPLWYNGTTNVAKGANTAGNRFSTATDNITLNFDKGGTITKNAISYFETGTGGYRYRTLNFADGFTYNLTTDTASAGINTNNGVFTINLGANSTLNLNATTGTTLSLTSGFNVSNGNGTILQGGTFNFNSGAVIAPGTSNSRTFITGNSTVNFNQGSSIYSNNSISNPYGSGQGTRLVVQNGTMNVNGANLYFGYLANSGESDARGYGLTVGIEANSNATFNLNSGTVTALGDARRGTSTLSAGVSFGTAANSGGTLNLNDGNLITTNIRAVGTNTAILNLNGGNIIVSTQIIVSTNASMPNATDTQLQARLDQFLTGFNSTPSETNRITIGVNGVTFDTSQIDATKTNGAATVGSPMGGTGDLRKIGANTLILSGAQLYTGNTIITGGNLALGTGASTGIARSASIQIKNGAIFDTSRRSAAYALGNSTNRQLLTNEGTGKVVGDINANYGRIRPIGTFTIDGNLSSTADSIFQFDNLNTDILNITGDLTLAADATIDLTNASLAAEQTYTLFNADTITATTLNFSGADLFTFDIDFTSNPNALTITAHAVPEPSTTALILASLALLTLSLRRRK